MMSDSGATAELHADVMIWCRPLGKLLRMQHEHCIFYQ